MNTAVDIINFAIVVAALAISVIGLLGTIHGQHMDRWTKNLFLTIFSLIIAYSVSDMLCQISLLLLGPDFAILSQIAIFCESFFSSVIMPILAIYLLRICKESIRCRYFYAVISLWIVYIILLIMTQFTDFIYYITPDNVYKRGSFYPILLVPPALLMLTNLVAYLKRRQLLSNNEKRAFLAYILIPMFCMLIQMTSYGILLIVLGTAVASLIMLLFIMNEESLKFVEQKLKISEQNFKARTLQMRPHFIYNTMTSIYYLCELDPPKAQRVVDDFTTYLKKNYSAIAKQEPIPFTEELTHTKAYLAVVKARYEELLFVEYDIEHTAFSCPPLTLEPLVENAVKHNLDPESDPLCIRIMTRREENCNVIIVENSGTDFFTENSLEKSGILHSSVNEDDTHIGLENVTLRLKTLCNGTLDIKNREQGGTIVTIRIPF
ncbi:MAG: histidine kinase [Lachnospiraceae bacterium]|nr:histidine kinase [Lachnospiraceae bacterium]